MITYEMQLEDAAPEQERNYTPPVVQNASPAYQNVSVPVPESEDTFALWQSLTLDTPLIVGRYYLMEIHIPFTTNATMEGVLTAAIKTAAITQNAIRFTGIEYIPAYIGTKRDGTLWRLRFQAIPNEVIMEAGFSPKIIFAALGGVLLLMLTATGTLKRFAILTDNAVSVVGKALDPATLIAIVIVLLIVVPRMRKG